MAQELLNQKGIMPADFYNQSFSDWIDVQNAKSRNDRQVDPLALARQLGAEF